MLEIKCPYKYRPVAMEEAVKDAFCLDLYFLLKRDHGYYCQVQFHLLFVGQIMQILWS